MILETLFKEFLLFLRVIAVVLLFFFWRGFESSKGILEDYEELFGDEEVLVSHLFHLGDESEYAADVDQNDKEDYRIFARFHDEDVVASEWFEQQESVKESYRF